MRRCREVSQFMLLVIGKLSRLFHLYQITSLTREKQFRNYTIYFVSWWYTCMHSRCIVNSLINDTKFKLLLIRINSIKGFYKIPRISLEKSILALQVHMFTSYTRSSCEFWETISVV